MMKGNIKAYINLILQELAERCKRIPRYLEYPPPKNVDIYVGTFIKTVQPQHTGKGGTGEYEPDSLTSIHRGIDRFLRENDYGFSLVASKEFQT